MFFVGSTPLLVPIPFADHGVFSFTMATLPGPFGAEFDHFREHYIHGILSLQTRRSNANQYTSTVHVRYFLGVVYIPDVGQLLHYLLSHVVLWLQQLAHLPKFGSQNDYS